MEELPEILKKPVIIKKETDPTLIYYDDKIYNTKKDMTGECTKLFNYIIYPMKITYINKKINYQNCAIIDIIMNELFRKFNELNNLENKDKIHLYFKGGHLLRTYYKNIDFEHLTDEKFSKSDLDFQIGIFNLNNEEIKETEYNSLYDTAKKIATKLLDYMNELITNITLELDVEELNKVLLYINQKNPTLINTVFENLEKLRLKLIQFTRSFNNRKLEINKKIEIDEETKDLFNFNEINSINFGNKFKLFKSEDIYEIKIVDFTDTSNKYDKPFDKTVSDIEMYELPNGNMILYSYNSKLGNVIRYSQIDIKNYEMNGFSKYLKKLKDEIYQYYQEFNLQRLKFNIFLENYQEDDIKYIITNSESIDITVPTYHSLDHLWHHTGLFFSNKADHLLKSKIEELISRTPKTSEETEAVDIVYLNMDYLIFDLEQMLFINRILFEDIKYPKRMKRLFILMNKFLGIKDKSTNDQHYVIQIYDKFKDIFKLLYLNKQDNSNKRIIIIIIINNLLEIIKLYESNLDLILLSQESEIEEPIYTQIKEEAQIKEEDKGKPKFIYFYPLIVIMSFIIYFNEKESVIITKFNVLTDKINEIFEKYDFKYEFSEYLDIMKSFLENKKISIETVLNEFQRIFINDIYVNERMTLDKYKLIPNTISLRQSHQIEQKKEIKQKGGYYTKYLKYKMKYLKLKDLLS